MILGMRTLTRLLSVAVVLSISLSLSADEAKPVVPKSAAAQAALLKLETAKRNAGTEYQQVMTAAGNKAAQELEAAKQAAMKSGNLNEANAIQAAIDGLKDKPRQAAAAASGGGGELRRRLESAKAITYYRGNKSSSIEFRPDGNVWENGKKWNVRWDVATYNGTECIQYFDGPTTARLVQVNDSTFASFHEGAEIPVAVVLK
jgi:hypothetical protein